VEALIKYGAKLNDMMGPMPPLHDVCAWLQTNPQAFELFLLKACFYL